MLTYEKPERGTKTYVATPVGEKRFDMKSSTKRNSIDGDPSRVAKDQSLERLDNDAMSLE